MTKFIHFFLDNVTNRAGHSPLMLMHQEPLLVHIFLESFPDIPALGTGVFFCYFYSPYPEPVYTGWSSVHWKHTEYALAGPVYTGMTLGDTTANLQTTLEHHWEHLFETVHTGMTLAKLSI